MKIFFNNKIISASQLQIDPSDRGLLLGDGLFETMRAEKGKVFFLQDHWERLQQGAKILQLQLPISLQQLEIISAQLLAENELNKNTAVVRLTITRGPGPRGLLPAKNSKPTAMLTALPLALAEKHKYIAIISTIRRNQLSPLANIKSLNCLDQVLAKMQAAEQQADEALMLNTQGHLAGASAANVFVLIDKMLVTPALADGALPGVVRKQIFHLAEQMNIKVLERIITIKDLFAAEEAFLTNSLLGIMPLVKVNERPIASGEIGSTTCVLREKYEKFWVLSQIIS